MDLRAQYLSIKEEIDKAIFEVIEDSAFIGGKYVEAFESTFAEMYGVKYCVSTANGTDSLYIIMRMLGIGLGDEVITAANSWISSSETITQAGASPVFVDISPDYFTIDVSKIEEKITNRTKAIIPVHLYGQVCDMEHVMAIANKYNLSVIEDCAQSHFSEYKGLRAGTIGTAGSFSFYPGKNLGAYGDAGCIITNDRQLAEKCRMFARHGALKKHQHKMEGINSRMDALQASILLSKLPYIDKWTEARIAHADAYNNLLARVDEITLPKVLPETKHTFHIYAILAKKRDLLSRYLAQNGIKTGIHYPTALPNLEAYAYLKHRPSDFPIATANQGRILSLPIYPELSSNEIKFVCEKVREFYEIVDK